MLEQLATVILEKGGLFAALFLGSLFLFAKREARWDARDVAKQQQIDVLTAARVADAQKTRDDVVGVNRQLVETMTRTNDMLDAVRDALDTDTDPTRHGLHAKGPPP